MKLNFKLYAIIIFAALIGYIAGYSSGVAKVLGEVAKIATEQFNMTIGGEEIMRYISMYK